MKLLLIFPNWLGRSGNYCHSAALELGCECQLVWGSDHDVLTLSGYFKDKARRAPLVANKFKRYEACALNRKIVEKVKNIRPDLVINNCPALFPETVQTLKDYSHSVVFWAGDDPTLFPDLMKTLKFYDFFFVGSPEWIGNEITTHRKESNFYLPYGCSPDVFKKIELNKHEKKKFSADISFLGARYSDRERILAELTEYDLSIWGWKKDNIARKYYRTIRGNYHGTFHAKYRTDEELYLPFLNRRIRGAYVNNNTANKIYNASSIILNLQHPQMHQAVNSKAFEIAASGGFQLFQHTGNLLSLFKKDTEIVCFSDERELKEKIRFYLDNPGERDLISARARKRVLFEHTFVHRLKTIFSITGRF